MNDDPLARLHQLTPRTWVTYLIVAVNVVAGCGRGRRLGAEPERL